MWESDRQNTKQTHQRIHNTKELMQIKNTMIETSQKCNKEKRKTTKEWFVTECKAPTKCL